VIVIGLFAAMLISGASAKPAAHATDIRADQDDEFTQKFADALRHALPKAKHMRPETGDDADDLYLTILFPLQVDGKRFSYAVDLMKTNQSLPPDRLASLTGNCRASALATCAQDVIEKADGKISD
jgi:hypothetical protein